MTYIILKNYVPATVSGAEDNMTKQVTEIPTLRQITG